MDGKRPNLFIVGAMKSGTTSLHQALSRHPEIFMSENKEPGYFVQELNWNKGENWYLSFFAGAKDQKFIGESSTHYSKLPNYQGVCERIYQFNKEAKIIYIMRNPIERAISHYWHNIHLSSLLIDERFIPEKRSIMKALEEEPDFINFSNYALQLKPYQSAFGTRNVFAVTFEKLVNQTNDVLNKLFNWLGLMSVGDSFYLPSVNVRGSDITQIRGHGILHRLRHCQKFNFIAPFIPAYGKELVKKFSVKKVNKDAKDLAQARYYLYQKQREQVLDLEELLGKRFPEWTEFYR